MGNIIVGFTNLCKGERKYSAEYKDAENENNIEIELDKIISSRHKKHNSSKVDLISNRRSFTDFASVCSDRTEIDESNLYER